MNCALNVLVVTFGEAGIKRINAINYPAVPGVHYVVGWQEPGNSVPDALSKRDDVLVVPTNTVGSSANRNAALEASTAPLLLVADDDLIYRPEQLRAVIDTMNAHPEVDIAAFAASGPGVTAPDFEFDLWQPPKGYYTCEWQIAMRREAVVKHGLRFNTLFGLNAPVLGNAEGAEFLYRARKAGLNGRYFPVNIVTHPAVSTGLRDALKPAVLMGEGAMFWLQYPVTWPLRLWLKAWRVTANGGYTWPTFRHLWRGASYARRHVGR